MVEDFAKEHNSSELLLNEYRQRLRNNRNEKALSRYPASWKDCYLVSCDLSGGKIVNIDKYNALLDRWEQFRQIRLSAERKHFEVVTVRNKSYIIGGMVSGNFVRSVSHSFTFGTQV